MVDFIQERLFAVESALRNVVSELSREIEVNPAYRKLCTDRQTAIEGGRTVTLRDIAFTRFLSCLRYDICYLCSGNDGGPIAPTAQSILSQNFEKMIARVCEIEGLSNNLVDHEIGLAPSYEIRAYIGYYSDSQSLSPDAADKVLAAKIFLMALMLSVVRFLEGIENEEKGDLSIFHNLDMVDDCLEMFLIAREFIRATSPLDDLDRNYLDAVILRPFKEFTTSDYLDEVDADDQSQLNTKSQTSCDGAATSTLQDDSVSSSQIENAQDAVGTALVHLNRFVGLTRVKEEISRLVDVSKVRALRSSAGLKVPDVALHLVFVGNPGTGKTSVARLIAEIYHALGLLSKGHLIESDRTSFVGEYVGQTALKTQSIIESALGGVLFIDEAYSLTPPDAQRDFGREAIEVLLKMMEDHREDLAVIVAGYPQEMELFMSSNPGLRSRFRTTIHFDDYTGEELIQLVHFFAQDNDYVLSSSAVDALQARLDSLKLNAGFANGRTARNLFEDAVSRQARRVVRIKKPTNNELRTLISQDFQP